MRADVPLRRIFVGLGFGALALLGGARAATAQTVPSCGDTTMFPNPIYLAGSSAFQPYASRMAPYLVAPSQTTKYTLIYNGTASLDGPTKIRDQVDLTGMASAYVSGTQGAAAPAIACAIAAGTKADVGIADVAFASFGTGTTLPGTVGDFLGPVQAMEFVVPKLDTTVTAISAEQAAAIYGCGATAMVGSFTNPMIDTSAQQRDMNSGTQIMVSKYIGLPAMFPFGHPNASTGNLVTSLLAVADAQQAIGFMSADNYDSRRTMLSVLAFRGIGQTHAYYADSTAASFDKKNVRDGHYLIQGPVHFFATVDTAGAASGAAKKFIDWVQGKAAIQEGGNPLQYVDIAAIAGTVPLCAMKVTRDTDGGFLKAYKPATSCGCYFDSKVPSGAVPAGCIACVLDGDCATGKTCQSGYCE